MSNLKNLMEEKNVKFEERQKEKDQFKNYLKMVDNSTFIDPTKIPFQIQGTFLSSLKCVKCLKPLNNTFPFFVDQEKNCLCLTCVDNIYKIKNESEEKQREKSFLSKIF